MLTKTKTVLSVTGTTLGIIVVVSGFSFWDFHDKFPTKTENNAAHAVLAGDVSRITTSFSDFKIEQGEIQKQAEISAVIFQIMHVGNEIDKLEEYADSPLKRRRWNRLKRDLGYLINRRDCLQDADKICPAIVYRGEVD